MKNKGMVIEVLMEELKMALDTTSFYYDLVRNLVENSLENKSEEELKKFIIEKEKLRKEFDIVKEITVKQK